MVNEDRIRLLRNARRVSAAKTNGAINLVVRLKLDVSSHALGRGDCSVAVQRAHGNMLVVHRNDVQLAMYSEDSKW